MGLALQNNVMWLWAYGY